MDDTLQKIAIQLGKAFSFLGNTFKSPQDLKRYFKILGWDTPPGFDDISFSISNLDELIEKLNAILESSPEDQENEALMITRISELIASTLRLLEQIILILDNLDTSLPDDYILKTNIGENFFIRLVDFLLANGIYNGSPLTFGILQLLGIFEQKYFPEDPNIYQVAHIRSIVNYDRIGVFFTHPDRLIKEGYGWGTNIFLSEDLLKNFAFLLNMIGCEVVFNSMSRKVEEALLNRSIPEADTNPSSRIVITLLREIDDEFGSEIKLVAYEVRPSNAEGTDGGIGFFPLIRGTTDIEFSLTDHLVLTLEGEIDFTGGLNLILRPNQSPYLETGMFTGPGDIPLTAKIMAGLLYGNDSEDPITLLTFPGGTKLDFQKIALKLGVEKQRTGAFEPLGELEIKNLRLIIGLSSADSFLQEGVASNELTASFDLTIGWAKNGIYFKGGASLELLIPTHIEIGPIELSNVIAAVKAQNESIILELGTTVALRLGPLNAVVENIGAKANLSFNNPSGSFGPLDLSLGFKPPNGLGLSIDADVVRGGGYLRFDFDREEYSGALELTFSNFLSLKAIGLITTKMPDGSKGFSLLIIITVEFGTGLQLGFGFTLLGVGGLLGLNRTSNGEALIAGIRAGSVANIMFPRNVVANAPRIISDLRAFFPAEEGKFLIGPMAKLGWGTPTLVSVSLGVIVEFSTQGSFSVQSLTILGVLKIALPTEEAPLLVLQVQFLGRIEFDKRRAYFFASLYDSRILFMTIEGEMGLLIDWSDNPNFVLSVGGFHPSFTPPPMPFPVPRRIAVELSNNPFYRVRVENYFAVTSNTVQFGARAELEFRIGDAFQINGHIAFDALFQFSPFYFIIGVSASVSLRLFGMGVFSIRLEFELSGPTPWRAKGTGYISFLFFEFSANFDVTWGDNADTVLEPITVLPLLRDELKKEQNWTARLPEGANIQVSLRKLEGASETLVLHPLGSLLITQRAIPLKLTLDKVGHQKPADFKKFALTVNAPGLTASDASEKFAIAQFQDMNDAEKLSRPAFQPEPGGLALSGDANGGYKTSWAAKRFVRYENIVIDTRYRRYQTKFFEWVGGLFSHFLVGSTVTQSALSLHQHKRLEPFADKIDITPPLFTVANMLDNTPLNTAARNFTSEAAAREFMFAEIGRDANLQESIHVIPNFEANF